MKISDIQNALRAAALEGWLFFDHHRRDELAYRILGIPKGVQVTRRWYCFVPSRGVPKKLVHRIESGTLDSVEGEKLTYSSWRDQEDQLRQILAGARRIAMQYSPNCAIPYVSLVDGGTLELVRGFGVEVVSSADLVQEFEARWTEEQFRMHLEAGVLVDEVRRSAFQLIGDRLRAGESIGEYDVQQFILRRFADARLVTDHGPVVAANVHASDPHYEPTLEKSVPIRTGDLVLIDLWAKLTKPEAVYYDITWTGYCGELIPDKVQNVFTVVRDARKRGTDFVSKSIAAGLSLAGFEVDDQVRSLIEDRGFGQYFFHRTGHSIGMEPHGTGANMDNLESHDERRIIPGTCFSIEPGIYLHDFGIRSEVNVYVGQSSAQVTGEQQEQLVRI